MKETTLPATPERKLVALAEEFSDYEIERLEKMPFDLMVYKYETGSYDGHGFAVWRDGDQFAYHELGHCSCNGPLDDIGSSAKMRMTLDQVATIAENHYDTCGKEVVAEMRARDIKN